MQLASGESVFLHSTQSALASWLHDLHVGLVMAVRAVLAAPLSYH